MTADFEEQENELLALHSIFDSEEFVRDESKSAGQIRVSVELPADFAVALKEGETLRQYEMSFLPPLLLTFELPEDYPSSSPPSFTLSCSWLTLTQLSALGAQLTDLYQATGGAVVLFTWVQFLKEDAFRFLDINTLLALPSDEHSTQNYSQESLDAALSEPKNNRYTSASFATKQILQTSDNQTNLSAAEVETLTPLAVSQSDQSGPEDFINEGSDSASSLFARSFSDPQDESEKGAASLPIQPRQSPPNEDQTCSGLSLTHSQILLSQLLIYDSTQKKRQFSITVFDCGVCFMSLLGSDCVQLDECGHIFCRACFGQFCKLQITEGNVLAVACLQADCTATPTPAQVKNLVGEELFSRYDRLLLQKTLDCMPDVVYCPRNTCGSVVIQEKSSTVALCSECSFAFCVICRKTNHGADDCQAETEKKKKKLKNEAEQGNISLPKSEDGIKALWEDYMSGTKKRRNLLVNRYGRKLLLSNLTGILSDVWITDNTKNCPHCFVKIQKDGGCKFMTCSRCSRRFCWTCLSKLLSCLWTWWLNDTLRPPGIWPRPLPRLHSTKVWREVWLSETN